MWIPKRPRPSYFCGCPGCGLCYDYVDEQPQELVESVATNITLAGYVPGLMKNTQDLLGVEDVSIEQMGQVSDGLRRIHARVKEEVVEEDPNKLAWIEMTVVHTIEQVQRTKAAAPRKELNTTTIDDMDPAKVKEVCLPEMIPAPDNNAIYQVERLVEQQAAANRAMKRQQREAAIRQTYAGKYI